MTGKKKIQKNASGTFAILDLISHRFFLAFLARHARVAQRRVLLAQGYAKPR